MGNAESQMQKQLIDLKITAKRLAREAKKCDDNEKKSKSKLKSAIERGDMEAAKIFANNAIRDKNQALNYLRLSSRIEAVAQRVNTAITHSRLTKTMSKTVKGMDKALASMDVEKIGKVMDKFEENFEDLDVRTAYMDNAIDSTTAGVTPEDQVVDLISMVADQNGLKLDGMLEDAPTKAPVQAAAATEQTKAPVAVGGGDSTDLEARFAALRKND